MSIVFNTSDLIPPHDSPEYGGDRRLTAEVEKETSSSSSIGMDSDSDDGGEDSGDGEVQSEFKGSLDCFAALEEVLPIKRGVSKFYSGKSKSFTSLADVVSCTSIKEIAKPENAITRKRKNLLAHSIFWDKDSNFPLRNNSVGISKKTTNSDRSASTISNEGTNSDSCNSNASSPILTRPPLHPQSRKSPNVESSSSPSCRNVSPWRSFSLSDLQGATTGSPTTALVVNKRDGPY